MKPLLLASLLLLGGCDKPQDTKPSSSIVMQVFDVGFGMRMTSGKSPECLSGNVRWKARTDVPDQYYCTTEDMPK